MAKLDVLSARLASADYDLLADLFLYPTADGGKRLPIQLGYGCPCMVDKSASAAWDAYPLVETPMFPGERRRVGFVCLSGSEAVAALSTTGTFFLWEVGIIGEAKIVAA